MIQPQNQLAPEALALPCDRCDSDVAKAYRDHIRSPKSALDGWLCWRGDDEIHTVEVLCPACHARLARRAQGLLDGPLSLFAGLRALPEYIRLTSTYRWTPTAIDRLQGLAVRLQLLPTGEGMTTL